MHYFSNLFDKALYMFRWSAVHHQEYLNTVYTQQVFVMPVLWLLCVYSVEILLMMDSGPVQNM